MNRKAIKYIITSLVMVGCLSTISKTTMANTISYSISNLESSINYADNKSENKDEKKDKHKGFNIFGEENSKYLSSEQKKDLLELKKCKDNCDNLTKVQEEKLHLIIDCIIKGKLGDKNYLDYKHIIEKKKSNEKLTEKEEQNLKDYREIIDGSKLSAKEILNQFLR